jgi:SAM-dependent methyltransferase
MTLRAAPDARTESGVRGKTSSTGTRPRAKRPLGRFIAIIAGLVTSSQDRDLLAPTTGSAVPKQMRERIEVFQCPHCQAALSADSEIRCSGCKRVFRVEDGIPCLYAATEPESTRERVTEQVRAFYEQTPFPNYEDFESIEDLVRKAESGLFARMLNDQIPFNSRVLEVGCGTGQLSNYLGIAQRSMFGADMTLNSLKLGNEFRAKSQLGDVGFYQMNLYRPIFKNESFDFVLCNGVLCATAEPYRGFESVAPLVKRGGHLLIGTYNTYGRLITDFRRAIIGTFGERFAFLDPHLRNEKLGKRKKDAWLADQYRHPAESKQSFGEVLSWFEAHDFEFVYGIPSPKAFVPFSEQRTLSETQPRGNWLDHAIVQTQLMFQGSYEGGFFVMIGRRK